MKDIAGNRARAASARRTALLLMLALGAASAASAAEPVVPRFSIAKAALAPEPARAVGARFGLTATLAPKAVPKDVSWDARFAVRASVAPKSLAAVTCGSAIFSDGFEN